MHNPKPAKELAYPKAHTEKYAAKMKDIMKKDKNGQLVTGGCCQWRGSASYDTDVHVETVVLRGKYSVEPPNSTPPERYAAFIEDYTHMQIDILKQLKTNSYELI